MQNCSFLKFLCLLIFKFAFLSGCNYQGGSKDKKLFESLTNIDIEKRNEFLKVISYYNKPGDTLKLKAAYFLISEIKGHYFLDGSQLKEYNQVLKKSNHVPDRKKFIDSEFDSLNSIYGPNSLDHVPDYKVIDSKYLIENIEYAFKAWQLPWSKSLSFEDFCNYILPYKISTEKPTSWRKRIFTDFQWVRDSLKDETDPRKVCTYVNNQLKWFQFQWPFQYPTIVDLDNIYEGKAGRCDEGTQLTAYVMRALGIPTVVDFTPQWGNRNYGHSWNSMLYKNNYFISFQGTETNPGESKIEYDPNDSWFFKRPKIYRVSYTKSEENSELIKNAKNPIPNLFYNQYYTDVTSDFVPTSNIEIEIFDKKSEDSFTYLCVFDNQKWVPVSWGKIEDQKASFKNIGRDILYIVAESLNNNLHYISKPFILKSDGDVDHIKLNPNKLISAKLKAKFPYHDSNKIKRSDEYELFYWNTNISGWKSIGRQKANKNFLIFDNIPLNSLLLLKDQSRGMQERPFIVKNNEQIFW